MARIVERRCLPMRSCPGLGIFGLIGVVVRIGGQFGNHTLIGLIFFGICFHCLDLSFDEPVPLWTSRTCGVVEIIFLCKGTKGVARVVGPIITPLSGIPNSESMVFRMLTTWLLRAGLSSAFTIGYLL